MSHRQEEGSSAQVLRKLLIEQSPMGKINGHCPQACSSVHINKGNEGWISEGWQPSTHECIWTWVSFWSWHPVTKESKFQERGPCTVQQSPRPLSTETHIHLFKMRHCGLANTWSHKVKVWLPVSVRTVDHPMAIPPVSKNVTARWYIYYSWLTPTFTDGSVGSEDQRGWREVKWNCPKLPALLSQNSKSQIILLPREMTEIREGKILNAVLLRSLRAYLAYLVHVGTGHQVSRASRWKRWFLITSSSKPLWLYSN